MKVPGSLPDLENLIQRVEKKKKGTKARHSLENGTSQQFLLTDVSESNGGAHRVHQITCISNLTTDGNQCLKLGTK